jgi:hypothetical protein
MTNPDTGKITWLGANKQRIGSVTDVLDGGAEALLNWAVGNAVAACETAAVRYLDCGVDLAGSILDFGALAQLTGRMPDTVRDDKAALGTAAHDYLAYRLGCPEPGTAGLVPYGYRCGIDAFIAEHQPVAVRDTRGLRVERAVGDFERAVAGTYDAQVLLEPGERGRARMVHRLDLKTCNAVQPKHWAQVAEYEREAVLCGEEPSDYCSILHVTPLGDFALHSIAVGSPDYLLALDTFSSYLQIRRGENRLAKLLGA